MQEVGTLNDGESNSFTGRKESFSNHHYEGDVDIASLCTDAGTELETDNRGNDNDEEYYSVDVGIMNAYHAPGPRDHLSDERNISNPLIRSVGGAERGNLYMVEASIENDYYSHANDGECKDGNDEKL